MDDQFDEMTGTRPDVSGILESMNWEERLEKARARRAQVLAQRKKDGTPPRKKIVKIDARTVAPPLPELPDEELEPGLVKQPEPEAASIPDETAAAAATTRTDIGYAQTAIGGKVALGFGVGAGIGTVLLIGAVLFGLGPASRTAPDAAVEPEIAMAPVAPLPPAAETPAAASPATVGPDPVVTAPPPDAPLAPPSPPAETASDAPRVVVTTGGPRPEPRPATIYTAPDIEYGIPEEMVPVAADTANAPSVPPGAEPDALAGAATPPALAEARAEARATISPPPDAGLLPAPRAAMVFVSFVSTGDEAVLAAPTPTPTIGQNGRPAALVPSALAAEPPSSFQEPQAETTAPIRIAVADLSVSPGAYAIPSGPDARVYTTVTDRPVPGTASSLQDQTPDTGRLDAAILVPPVYEPPRLAGAASYRVHLFAPSTVDDGRVAVLSEDLGETGVDLAPVRRVSFKVSEDQIRYFHGEDREAALFIAELIGATPRDFTGFRPSPPEGTLEVYTQGEGARPPARTTTRRNTGASEVIRLRDRLVRSLRRGDHL